MRHVIQPGHFSSSLRSYIQTLQDPLKFVLAAGIGTLLLVSLVVLRIHLVSQVLHQEGENNLCQKKRRKQSGLSGSSKFREGC